MVYFSRMNFHFNHLSFWERNWLTDDLDFTIVGAGIVGLSAAFHLRKKHPKAKILILDKGILPFSASSKNAGFACFGSPSEILDDLLHIPQAEVWQTVEMRWNGLRALKNWLGETEIDLHEWGSWDLMDSKTHSDAVRDKLSTLNQEMEHITGHKNVFSEDNEAIKRFGFSKLETCFYNRLEGQLDSSLLMQRALKSVADSQINILRGVELKSYQTNTNHVILNTPFGELKTKHLVLCTNGFTHLIEKKIDLKPARAQVLITEPIPNLKIKGTFHIDAGYFYFRNIRDRILIGGGRNVNFASEETTVHATTDDIQASILGKLQRIVLPQTAHKIAYSWAGIMGVGSKKSPIIERIDSRVSMGVRMGGMGVAIGTLVGQALANLQD